MHNNKEQSSTKKIIIFTESIDESLDNFAKSALPVLEEAGNAAMHIVKGGIVLAGYTAGAAIGGPLLGLFLCAPTVIIEGTWLYDKFTKEDTTPDETNRTREDSSPHPHMD